MLRQKRFVELDEKSSFCAQLVSSFYHLGQGSATPGTRATGGTREDFFMARQVT